MHRVVLRLSFYSRIEVEHINGNKLDCRRSNLRKVTHPTAAQAVSVELGQNIIDAPELTAFDDREFRFEAVS